MPDGAITWDEHVVPDVINLGKAKGWTHHKTQPRQGHLVILHKPNPNGGVKLMKLNIWCTTGTVGSYLFHPKSAQKRSSSAATFPRGRSSNLLS